MRKILTYCLLSILSAHVFAGEGSGFKIIDEKTEITPGVKGGFIKTTHYLNNKNLSKNIAQAVGCLRCAGFSKSKY